MTPNNHKTTGRLNALPLACILILLMVTQTAQAQPPALKTPVWNQIRLKAISAVNDVDGTFNANFEMFTQIPTPVPRAVLNGTDYFPLTEALKTQLGLAGGALNLDSDFENTDEFQLKQKTEFLTPFVQDFLYSDNLPADVEPYTNTTACFFRWQSVNGTFRANFQLHDFPIDEQVMSIKVRMRLPDAFYMAPHPTARFATGMEPLVQWEFIRETTTTETTGHPAIGANWHTISYNVYARRNPNYYYLKIVSGVVMVVLMNLMMFGLDIMDSNRMVVCFICYVAIIWYQFLVSEDVPKVSYSTRIDKFIIISMIDVALGGVAFAAQAATEKGASIAIEKLKEALKEKQKRSKLPPTAFADPETEDEDEDATEGDNSPVGNRKKEGSGRGTPQSREPLGSNRSPTTPAAKRPQIWADKWFKYRSLTNILLFWIVALVYGIGAPVVLWGVNPDAPNGS